MIKGSYQIDPAKYIDKITPDLSPDPDDRVHAAAVIYGEVDVLLTRNFKHLSTEPVLTAGVEVMTSDDFLSALLARHTHDVVASFTRAASNKKHPPMTPEQLADRISAAGAPGFAKQLEPFLSH